MYLFQFKLQSRAPNDKHLTLTLEPDRGSFNCGGSSQGAKARADNKKDIEFTVRAVKRPTPQFQRAADFLNPVELLEIELLSL